MITYSQSKPQGKEEIEVGTAEEGSGPFLSAHSSIPSLAQDDRTVSKRGPRSGSKQF